MKWLTNKLARKRPVPESISADIEKHFIAAQSGNSVSHAAEQSSLLTEPFYRSLFDSMLNGLAYCRMLFDRGRPQDFIYLEVNTAFEIQTGLKNVTGKRVSEVVPGIRESDPTLFETYGRVCMTGIPESFETYIDALNMWFSVSVYSPQKEYFVAVFDVITERKQAESRIKLLNRLYATLSHINEAIVRIRDRETLFKEICRITVEHGKFRMAWIGMVDESGELVNPVAVAGDEQGYLTHLVIKYRDEHLGAGPTGTAIREGHCVVCQDIANDQYMIPWRESALQRGYRSSAAVPFRQNGCVIGALTVYAAEPNNFDADDKELLDEISSDISFALDSMNMERRRNQVEETLKESLDNLQKALNGAINATVKMSEMRDPYTAGHQQRVAEIAVAMAQEMNLPDEQIEHIRIAAKVHDIGKIYVPAEILSKPGKLSEMEFDIIKTHATGSYEILKDIEFGWPIAQIVLQHHERIDGSGYPYNLAGKDILLEAKVLMVADVVEAMVSHRPYRPALGIDVATAELRRSRGVRLDADIVDVCLKLIAQRRLSTLVESTQTDNLF